MAAARAPFKLWFIFAINFMGQPREPKNALDRNALFAQDSTSAFGIDREQFTLLAPPQ